MIDGLQVKEERQNGQVYYHPVVLTVSGVSQYRDTEISFSELDLMHTVVVVDPASGEKKEVENYAYWGISRTDYVFVSGPREKGTTLGTRVVDSDGKPEENLRLHVGDVAEFSLNLNPKRGSNAKPGSYYYNIGRVGPSNGQPPIAAQRQTESSGSTWSGASASADTPDAKDIRIGKAQAVNLLFDTLLADQKKTGAASKIIAAMGFESVEEAAEVAANAWNHLRNGLPLEIAIAEAPVEEDEVNDPVEAEVEENPDEVVETLDWN